jgi:hypothetical protein
VNPDRITNKLLRLKSDVRFHPKNDESAAMMDARHGHMFESPGGEPTPTGAFGQQCSVWGGMGGTGRKADNVRLFSDQELTAIGLKIAPMYDRMWLNPD